jgi:ABC-type phosphate/phosphonate transport system substrate-binding protein
MILRVARLQGLLWLSAAGWLALAATLRAGEAPASGINSNAGLFRLGFSSATFSDVNENDAKAGVKVWAQSLFHERGLPVDPEPVILNGSAVIAEALRTKRIDAITLNTDEFWQLGRDLLAGPFIGGVNEGRITEEYVVLVHRDSKINGLEQLRGQRMLCLQNMRMSLAPVWLDTLLLKGGFPRTDEFCKVTRASKLMKVVLPVFFRQADACLVTRRGFKTMSELNPQVGERLKVLATSPELVPTGFCFRHGYTDPLKDRIVAELAGIKNSPAGQQLLTLFQSGSLEAQPISCLDSAFELLETHRRLRGGTNVAPGAVAGTVGSSGSGGRP